jgi:hypothetical protein
MTDSKERRCACCRKTYTFCPRCPQDAGKPYFYYTFCSENCKDIYNTLSAFTDKDITATEANERLNTLDLSRIEDFGESYRNTIAKVRTESDISVAPATDDITTISINETADVEPTVEWVQSVPDNEKEEKKNYRKSKKKADNDVE